MKKSSWKLVLCLALAVVMLACTALAATAPDVAQASGATVTVGDGDKLTVTVTGLTAGKQYALLQVKVDAGSAATAQALLDANPSYSVSEASVLYIDQAADNSGTVTFANFLPKSMATSLFVLGGGDQAQVVGAMLTQGVTITGTATAKGATTGDVIVTVKDSNGAEVGTATVTSGTAYSIDGIPEEAGLTVEVSSTIKGKQDKVKYVTRTYELDATAATELNVELWPKGDANGDGRVTAADATAIFNSVRVGSTAADKLTGYAAGCANANGDARLTAADATAIFNHLRLGSTDVLW